MEEEHKVKYVNREISWLSFNDRVLQEAEDPRVPLLDRIKFLGIFSSNMDEFFRVRVASLRRMADLGENAKHWMVGKPKKVLNRIQQIVLGQRYEFDLIYRKLLTELADERIYIVNEKQLSPSQGEFVRDYFHNTVRPALVPIMIDAVPVQPILRDKMVYFAVGLTLKGKTVRRRHAIIELPTEDVPRFLVLPPEGDKNFIILLDDVIRYCLGEIFYIFPYNTIEAYTIKLTRDAELEMDDDLSESFLQKISKSLKQRKKGRLVRFIYDEEMPADMLKYLTRKLKLLRGDNILPGARYHNFKDFIDFPGIGPAHLHQVSVPPVPHRDIPPNRELMGIIAKKDILLHYPYQSFNYFIDLIREAAIDPLVISIKITLYRVAESSKVINALINAMRNGKQVTAVVELQARFDEEANIFWATRLREEGAKVIFGVPSMKVHAKMCVITRKEKRGAIRYAYIGTGNFNEETSRTYSDHGLFTANQEIAGEVNQVFNFLDNNMKPGSYRNLLISPFFMRTAMVDHINREIENAKAGRPAWMILKMNSLVDPDMIQKLYEASLAGVIIQLIIRGICCLKPGVKHMSENISVISIVDKYLEHSRIFLFCDGGKEKMYFGSADWMVRNLDHRIEVDCPVYDQNIKNELKAFLYIQLKDNTKARVIDKTQANAYVADEDDLAPAVRAQEEVYEMLSDALKSGKEAFLKYLPPKEKKKRSDKPARPASKSIKKKKPIKKK